MKVETYGDYSKCPKCEKNIKSTFIIRHIKLHDQPSLSMKCPYQDCATSFTRSAALLKVSRRFRGSQYSEKIINKYTIRSIVCEAYCHPVT